MKTYRSKETGLFVGRQVDQVDGETYEVVEVPTSKDELIEFLNQSQQVSPVPAADSPPLETSPVPQSTEAEQTYARFRADVAEGRVDLEETLWAAPLEVCLRLASIVYERTHEHFVKGQQHARSESIRREREHGEAVD